jgi:penicillin-binding protein 2
MNMVRFYAMLASPTGTAPTPHLVKSAEIAPRARRSLGLSASDLAGLRSALVAVVDRGTAAASRIADLKIAGKTGTAQNPHGPDHGWFIAFAPADSPRVVAGAIIEFAEHGSSVAPLVTRIIARHLLGDGAPGRPEDYRLVVPADSAPESVPILPDTLVARGPP